MKNILKYLSILIALLFFSNPLLFADNDEDDDGDDNGDDKSLTITGAEPDFEGDTLLITGNNFAKGNNFKGKVLLFFPPETGSVELNVLNFDPTNPQMILADLPDGIEEFSGTYLLLVTKDNSNSPKKRDDFDITFTSGGDGTNGPTGL